MPVIINADRIKVSTMTPNGLGSLGSSGGSNVEAAMVEKVSWTTVPAGGAPGVTILDVNEHEELAGSPEQVRAKVRFANVALPVGGP
jgi:hypothetical protein